MKTKITSDEELRKMAGIGADIGLVISQAVVGVTKTSSDGITFLATMIATMLVNFSDINWKYMMESVRGGLDSELPSSITQSQHDDLIRPIFEAMDKARESFKALREKEAVITPTVATPQVSQ
jgi:hypothetical protein